MTTKITHSKLYSFLLVFFFFMGIQFSSDAQITVKNATNCTLFVVVSQNDFSTPAPCDGCPVNPPQFLTLLPMTSQTIFGQDVCFEQWGWVAWSTGAGFGITRNPGLGGACGASTFGPGCAGSVVTTANWFMTNVLGTGPVGVVIQ